MDKSEVFRLLTPKNLELDASFGGIYIETEIQFITLKKRETSIPFFSLLSQSLLQSLQDLDFLARKGLEISPISTCF